MSMSPLSPWHPAQAPHRTAAPPAAGAATVAAAAAEQPQDQGGLGRTVTLGLLFGLWYMFNIQFNM